MIRYRLDVTQPTKAFLLRTQNRALCTSFTLHGVDPDVEKFGIRLPVPLVIILSRDNRNSPSRCDKRAEVQFRVQSLALKERVPQSNDFQEILTGI